ncbi:hypothetical protein WMF38_32150 [Sorangium sp. So ce118]
MEDVSQAISIEVRSILSSGWSLATEGSMIVVVGPDAQDFISEVWRIARFVAYDDYVSIERQAGPGKEYRISSRSRSDLAFDITIRASK